MSSSSLPPTRSSPSFAYVTLVMCNDKYVGSALALATSLRQVGTQHPLYCMIGDGVSEKAVKALQQVFDETFHVDLLTLPCRKLPTKRQQELYRSWIQHSFTKWQCMNPNMYRNARLAPRKIIFLDADIIVLQNLDHLFAEVRTPCVSFSNWWSEKYQGSAGVREIYNRDRELKLGERISISDLEYSLNFKNELRTDSRDFTFCLNAVTAVLTPSRCFHDMMLKVIKMHQEDGKPFGFSGVFSGFDEQMLALCFILLKWNVYHLTPGYLWNAGAEKWIEPSKRMVIHYYGDAKPAWIPRFGPHIWPDTQVFWSVVDDMTKQKPKLVEWFPTINAVEPERRKRKERSRSRSPRRLRKIHVKRQLMKREFA